MLFLRQGATHKVLIGPVVAVGDGFTPVTTLALNTADEAEALVHDSATVVDISAYTFAAVTTADGYYVLTLQSGISGTVGHMTVLINDDSLCLPVKAEFTVLEEAVYDAFYAASATGVPAAGALEATAQSILTDTAVIGSTGQGLTSLATQASVNTIDDFLDTEIAAITAAVITNAAGVDIAADIIAIKAETAAILADTDVIGAAGAGLTEAGGTGDQFTAIVWNANWDAEVQSEVADALAVYDPPTRAELTTDINSVLNILQGLVLVQGTIGATGNDSTHLHLDGLTYGDDELNGYFIVVFDNSTSEYHVTDITDWVLSTELATVTILPFTPESSVDTYWLIHAQAGSSSAPTAAEVADAVWDEAQADHATAGTFGEVATETAAILVDTAEIGAAGAGLTAINLPNQTMDITGNITGNLSGSVGSVTGAVGSVTGDVGGLAAGAIADVWTTALTEAYAADGAAFTGAQALFMVWAFLAEKAIVTTTLTANQLDGVTPAMTFTLDDGTNPTSLTRAT
jgi:hypothetical protein